MTPLWASLLLMHLGSAQAQPVPGSVSGAVRAPTQSHLAVDSATGDVQGLRVTGGGVAFDVLRDATYDRGRRKSWTDELQRHVTVTQYDATFGLPARLEYALDGGAPARVVEVTYDELGRPASVRDLLTGATTTQAWDALGRRLSSTTLGALGVAGAAPDTAWTYAHALSDGGATVTTSCANTSYSEAAVWEDGLLARRALDVSPPGVSAPPAVEALSYVAGRLDTRTDMRGVLHQASYTPGEGFLSSVQVPAEGLVEVAYTPDSEGRPLGVTDDLGTAKLVRRDGRAAAVGEEAAALATGLASNTLATAETDAAGYATFRTAGSKRYVTETDALGRVTRLASADGSVDERRSYDAAGRLVSFADAVTGLLEAREYRDVLGRLTTLRRRVPSSDAATGASLTQEVLETRAYLDSAATRTTTVTIVRTLTGTATQTETVTQVLDSRGLLLSVTAPVTGQAAPQTTTFAYDALGHRTRRIDALGHQATWTYDAAGRLFEAADEEGHVTRYAYFPDGLLKSVEGPHPEARVEYSYDGLGRLETRTEARGGGLGDATWQYAYPGDGTVVETLPTQETVTRTLNGRGQLVKEVFAYDLASGATRTTAFAYDGDAVLTQTVADGAWLLTRTQPRDARGRPEGVQLEAWGGAGALASRSYGYQSTYGAWAPGSPPAVPGPRVTVTHQWNGFASQEETLQYDAQERLLRRQVGDVADAWTYDALGRLVAQQSAGEAARAFVLGPDGRVAREDFGSEATEYAYDERGLLRTVLTPDGRTLTQTHGDARGLLTRETYGKPGATFETTMAYDEAGRLVSRTVAGEATTSFDYGPRGELRSVVVPVALGGTASWQYGYDALNRLAQVTPPPGGGMATQAFTYNGLGQETWRRLGSSQWATTWQGGGVGVTTSLEGNHATVLLDGQGKVAQVSYAPGAVSVPPSGLSSKAFEYDGWGALRQVTESRAGGLASTVQAFGYDASHRLASVSRGGEAVSYGYVPGTRQRAWVTGPVGGGLSYGYDAYGRVHSVAGPWGSTTVNWEAGGQRLVGLSDGLVDEAFVYEDRGWLETVQRGPSDVTQYAYDARGNRVTETRTGASPGVRRFAYDLADRLVAAQEWDGHSEAYRLHEDGTRAEEADFAGLWPVSVTSPSPTRHVSFEYLGHGALGTVRDVATQQAEAVYAVDGDGRVTQRTRGGVVTGFAWDVEGRLVRASVPSLGLVADYEYDGLGLRRRATVTQTPPAGPPVVTSRTWAWGGEDGEEEVAEGADVVARVAGYVVGQGAYRYGHDGLGSPVVEVSAFATGANSAQYSAWGLRQESTLRSSLGFTGYRDEAALGLEYAQQRWMEPAYGGFLSVDPLGAAGRLSTPNALGPWAYGNLAPTRFTDADGRDAAECARMGLTPQLAKWGNNPKCLEGGSTWREVELAYAAYHAERSAALSTNLEDSRAQRRLRTQAEYEAALEFKAWHQRYIGKPLFWLSVGAAAAGTGTACAITPGCLVVAKVGGGTAVAGLFTSGQPTVKGVAHTVRACGRAIDNTSKPTADDAECAAALGGVAPAAPGAMKGLRAFAKDPLGMESVMQRAVSESFAEFYAETQNGRDVAAVYGELESANVADFGGWRASKPAAGGVVARFSSAEMGIVNEVRGIPLGQLRAAFAAGGGELSFGGRTIVVAPGMPASGMTLFGENGFVLGREAFASEAELTRTLLHETYRLTTSQSAAGVSGALATQETNAAFSFAQQAWEAFFR